MALKDVLKHSCANLCEISLALLVALLLKATNVCTPHSNLLQQGPETRDGCSDLSDLKGESRSGRWDLAVLAPRREFLDAPNALVP